MEYLSFGRLLERCRFAQLPLADEPRRALVLGDGDGRFLARLLVEHPYLEADVVDLAPAMMCLAEERVRHAGAQARVRLHVADARTYIPADDRIYDLVTSHFFLDCLSEGELDSLLHNIAPNLAPNTVFLYSDFAIPDGEPLRSIARVLVSALYLAFRVLTSLSVRELPNHAACLHRAGFRRESTRPSLGGILLSERWRHAP